MKTQSAHYQIWQAHIQSWEKSGLSQKTYCDEQGFKLATFGSWRKRLRASEQERISFIKSSPKVQEEGTPGKVVLQLLFPNGVRLGLNEDINESLLHQVLHFAGVILPTFNRHIPWCKWKLYFLTTSTQYSSMI